MATLYEYGQIASVVYKKSPISQLPIPSGFTQLSWEPDRISGFSVGAYQKGNEIVISFAGTNGEYKGALDYATGNIPAGTGLFSIQVLEAMEFYLAVRDANPGAQISFTGHSLGGGLASLMAVYFNKAATVFDPAPFLLSAVNQATLGYYQIALAVQGLSDPEFSAYTSAPTSLFGARQSQVEGHTLDGEILLDIFGRSGTIVDPNRDTRYQTLGNTAPVNLHSILLLSAVIRSETFRQAILNNAAFLPALFDESLYTAKAETSNTKDFMHTLMQKEWAYTGSASDSPLNRLAADLEQIDGAGITGQNKVQEALTIAAMEYYYFKDTADATGLFSVSNGGLHFKYSDISTTLAASQYKSLPRLQDAIEGLLNPVEQTFANRLRSKNAWHLQQGSSALQWTAASGDTENDAAIGGVDNDAMTAVLAATS